MPAFLAKNAVNQGKANDDTNVILSVAKNLKIFTIFESY